MELDGRATVKREERFRGELTPTVACLTVNRGTPEPAPSPSLPVLVAVISLSFPGRCLFPAIAAPPAGLPDTLTVRGRDRLPTPFCVSGALIKRRGISQHLRISCHGRQPARLTLGSRPSVLTW